MSEFRKYKHEVLAKNPKLKAEYDALEAEYDIIQAMIDARKSQNLTQKELSARTGITQADISRIEKGNRNPSLNMLKKLAAGLGMTLKMEFIPKSLMVRSQAENSKQSTPFRRGFWRQSNAHPSPAPCKFFGRA